MKGLLLLLPFVVSFGYSQKLPVQEFPQWSSGKPSIEDVNQEVGTKPYFAQEFIRTKVVQERTGEHLSYDNLTTGGFTTLYFDYYYLYDLKFGKSAPTNFTINIPLLKQGEKIRELEVVEYSINSKGGLIDNKVKNVIKERKKVDNIQYVIEVKIEGILPESFYQISYIIRSSNFKECSPRILKGDLNISKTRFALDIPDFLKMRSNYDSLGYHPSLISNKPWYLDKYSVRDVGTDSASDSEIINCAVYKWIFDEPTDFFEKVYFDVLGIDIPTKNDYGLNPRKFQAKPKSK